MQKTARLRFETPGLPARLKSMMGVDFYRLFHTPMFGIFLAIAALIPALILSTSGTDGSILYESAWEIIAAQTPIYVVSDIGQYANMNMVFIFGGIMVSIFIGHDYSSGYVKQLFTTHSHKLDYMASKTAVCAFAMASMCLVYTVVSILTGLLTGMSFQGNPGSILLAILGKMVMSLGWASLFTFINVLFRRYFGVSVAASFFFGTGMVIIGLAAIVGQSPILNIFLYGASVNACLSSNIGTLLICVAVSAGWTLVWNLLGTLVLSRCDVY